MNFRDIRPDWYRSNSLLPRLLRRSLAGRCPEPFLGFPRHWIPLFTWCDAGWSSTVPAPPEVPLFHPLTEASVNRVTRSAQSNGTLRLLVESAASCDPLVADALYQVDNSPEALEWGHAKELTDRRRATTLGHRAIQMSTWQSYGRPSIRRFERECLACPVSAKTVALLPCSRARPYNKSRTHRRLESQFMSAGYPKERLQRVVITAVGVVPEPLWDAPVAMEYDAGVPDIYRLLGLMRAYFRTHRFARVIDCLSFQPYSDLLGILAREHAIPRPLRVLPRTRSAFHVRHTIAPTRTDKLL